jgi:hypothetical protein
MLPTMVKINAITFVVRACWSNNTIN